MTSTSTIDMNWCSITAVHCSILQILCNEEANGPTYIWTNLIFFFKNSYTCSCLLDNPGARPPTAAQSRKDPTTYTHIRKMRVSTWIIDATDRARYKSHISFEALVSPEPTTGTMVHNRRFAIAIIISDRKHFGGNAQIHLSICIGAMK